jgi:hypothetical protein
MQTHAAVFGRTVIGKIAAGEECRCGILIRKSCLFSRSLYNMYTCSPSAFVRHPISAIKEMFKHYEVADSASSAAILPGFEL